MKMIVQSQMTTLDPSSFKRAKCEKTPKVWQIEVLKCLIGTDAVLFSHTCKGNVLNKIVHRWYVI